MLTYLNSWGGGNLTEHEDKHPFVECATFADDYKYHGEGWQGDFHFIDIPNYESGAASDYDFETEDRNLTYALTDIVAWLSGKQGDSYKQGYMYNYLMPKFGNDEDLSKSYALRLLVHYVGDLVQPFHCETRFNDEFNTSDGDKGANMFPLKYHYDVDELHALWDKILYDGYHNIPRPIDDDSWAELQLDVSDVMINYAYAVSDSSKYESLDYHSYAQESFDIAT